MRVHDVDSRMASGVMHRRLAEKVNLYCKDSLLFYALNVNNTCNAFQHLKYREQISANISRSCRHYGCYKSNLPALQQTSFRCCVDDVRPCPVNKRSLHPCRWTS